ncbi:Zn-ribbon domain-containing OB-fold protein [Ammoniphilus sp. YIM 78166]|uniref:Zn-ribbon domain-containing OB-fold protein n=1 Tax=Ammoniphilus sp. YIM 78166 TaxID=1644106 RepID=UPI00106FBAA6|nr:Zn-ribbon domain-containing OB-fold protein [Ammoniphilus sp. YIM 78166]
MTIKLYLDDDSRPFWEGAKDQKLMIQQCEECQKFIFYPRILCPHCFSEHVKWVEASGHGRIHSYTVVHKAMPPFKDQTPYVVGIIELNEGVRMMSRIVGERDQISIDKPVTVVYEKIDDEVTLPYFQLSET